MHSKKHPPPKDWATDALAALHTLESQRDVIRGRLLQRRRRIGTRLRLRYDATDDRFVWAWLEDEARNVWVAKGAAVPREVFISRPRHIQEKITGIQCQIQMLHESGSVLRALDQLARHAGDPPSPVIDVVWNGGREVGSTLWVFMLGGKILRKHRGPLQIPVPPPAGGGYGESLRQATGQRLRPYGEYTDDLWACLAKPAIQVEDQLVLLDEQLKFQRLWPRLYRIRTRDSWEVRRFAFAGEESEFRRTVPVTAKELPGLIMTVRQGVGREDLYRTCEALQSRAAIRRLCQIVAEVATVANTWPGGRWLLKGHQVGVKTAEWFATTTVSGRALYRDYRKSPDVEEPADGFDEDADTWEDMTVGPEAGIGDGSEMDPDNRYSFVRE
jgi:hypothetical protein